MQALNEAIGARLVEIKERIPLADGSTRWERFTADESGLLQALPADGFDSVEWKQLKVGRNYHVSCDSQHYSVPYTYAGQLLRLRVTSTTVTVFDEDQVIWSMSGGRAGRAIIRPCPGPAPGHRRTVVQLRQRKIASTG